MSGPSKPNRDRCRESIPFEPEHMPWEKTPHGKTPPGVWTAPGYVFEDALVFGVVCGNRDEVLAIIAEKDIEQFIRQLDAGWNPPFPTNAGLIQAAHMHLAAFKQAMINRGKDELEKGGLDGEHTFAEVVQ